MGQYLSSPVTTKTSSSGGNARLLFGLSSMQGWRISMEDAHAAVLDLDEGKDETNSFFAVYDGHSGSEVAVFAGQNVHKRLVAEETYRERQYELALKRAFLGIDEDLLTDPEAAKGSGCTAVAALITHDGKIYVANAGDSRSVISVKGQVKPLSYDHKASEKSEATRIIRAGGYIERNRVNGGLSPSRALGDFRYKTAKTLPSEEQAVTANPDVICHEITEEDEFLVIACDGIWDSLSSQDVVDFVRYQFSEGKDVIEICEMLFDHCLGPECDREEGGRGADNMSIVIVVILQGRTKAQWYTWIADRVKNDYGRKTPNIAPELYTRSYEARKEANEARRRAQQEARERAQKEATEARERVQRERDDRRIASKVHDSIEEDNKPDSRPGPADSAKALSVKVGDTIAPGTFSYIPYTPEFENNNLARGISKTLSTDEWKGLKVVIFSVTGAFTPTCHDHLHLYLQKYDEFKAKGVDVIAVVAANDEFVMSGWGRFEGVKDQILTLSDINATWSASFGLGVDQTAKRWGIRTAQYAIVLDDLQVKYVGVEPGPGVSVSGAEAVLAKL